jgi:hypothetical protein
MAHQVVEEIYPVKYKNGVAFVEFPHGSERFCTDSSYYISIATIEQRHCFGADHIAVRKNGNGWGKDLDDWTDHGGKLL